MVTGGEYGVVASKSCSLWMGCWLVCFTDGERPIIISAGRLVGASAGINPAGSVMVSYAMFVQLVNNVSRGCSSVIVSVFVMASCSAILLDVQEHPNEWSPYLLNVAPHVHFLV